MMKHILILCLFTLKATIYILTNKFVISFYLKINWYEEPTIKGHFLCWNETFILLCIEEFF